MQYWGYKMANLVLGDWFMCLSILSTHPSIHSLIHSFIIHSVSISWKFTVHQLHDSIRDETVVSEYNYCPWRASRSHKHINYYNLVNVLLKVYAVNLECEKEGLKAILNQGEESQRKLLRNILSLNLSDNSSNLECQSLQYSLATNTAYINNFPLFAHAYVPFL